METIKQRLSRGDVLNVAALGRIVHHNLVQMIGMHGGFHGLWFDMEHMDYSTEKLEILTIAGFPNKGLSGNAIFAALLGSLVISVVSTLLGLANFGRKAMGLR